jgi:hypothetical protein
MNRKVSEHQKKWPNLFLIGPPRSGTTTLYEILASHPDIFMSKVKEPNYFSTPPIPRRHFQILGATQDKETYLGLFEKASKDPLYLGEGTTHYLSDKHAAERISKHAPDAKIITILRNPVERAYSGYLLLGRRDGNKKSFYETIKENIKDLDNKNKQFGNFALQGLYSKQLKSYYKHFPKENILVLSFEDLKNNRQALLKQVADFLGVDSKKFTAKSVEKNVSQKPRNQLSSFLLRNQSLTKYSLKLLPHPLLRFIRNKLLLKKADKKPMDLESRNLLERLYKEELKNFDKLLSKNKRTGR